MTNKKDDHMEKRRKRGHTYRELADEFGTSKSTAHRRMKEREREKDAEDDCE